MTTANGSSPDSAMFKLPDDAAKPRPERRTWEGYASDFRDLTKQLATVQGAQEALRAEHAALGVRYETLQRQRRDDQDRFALLSRARGALEANSVAQATRTRAAQDALAARDATLARLEAERDATEAERARLSAAVATAQTALTALHAEMDVLRDTIDAQRTAASGHIAARSAGGSRRSPIDRLLAALALRRARQAARRRDWARAAALYTVVLMTRDEPRIWVQLGHALREQKAFLPAANAYRQALGRGLPDGEVHFMIGLSAARAGDAGAALAAYRQALRCAPGLRDTYAELRDPGLAD